MEFGNTPNAPDWKKKAAFGLAGAGAAAAASTAAMSLFCPTRINWPEDVDREDVESESEATGAVPSESRTLRFFGTLRFGRRKEAAMAASMGSTSSVLTFEALLASRVAEIAVDDKTC